MTASLLFPLLSSQVEPAVESDEASNQSFMEETSEGENNFLAIPWRPAPEESLALSPSNAQRPCKLATPTGAEGTSTPMLRLTTVPPEFEAMALK